MDSSKDSSARSRKILAILVVVFLLAGSLAGLFVVQHYFPALFNFSKKTASARDASALTHSEKQVSKTKSRSIGKVSGGNVSRGADADVGSVHTEPQAETQGLAGAISGLRQRAVRFFKGRWRTVLAVSIVVVLLFVAIVLMAALIPSQPSPSVQAVTPPQQSLTPSERQAAFFAAYVWPSVFTILGIAVYLGLSYLFVFRYLPKAYKGATFSGTQKMIMLGVSIVFGQAVFFLAAIIIYGLNWVCNWLFRKTKLLRDKITAYPPPLSAKQKIVKGFELAVRAIIISIKTILAAAYMVPIFCIQFIMVPLVRRIATGRSDFGSIDKLTDPWKKLLTCEDYDR